MDTKVVVVGSVGVRVEKEVEGVAMGVLVDGTPYISQRGPLRPRFGLAGIARCGSGLTLRCCTINRSEAKPQLRQCTSERRPSAVSTISGTAHP